MKFELLSTNTMILIDRMLDNKNLVKLIDNNSKSPLSEKEVLDTGRLVMTKIFPVPFTGDIPENEEVNLRVFYPNGRLQNRAVLNSKIHFQIILHKRLWTMTQEDGKTKALRPYEIMAEIIKTFENKSCKTLGVIHFENYYHQYINKDFSAFTLEAVMMTI